MTDFPSVEISQPMRAGAEALADTLAYFTNSPITRRLSEDTRHTIEALRERRPLLNAIADGSKEALDTVEVSFLAAQLTHRIDRLEQGARAEIEAKEYAAAAVIPPEQWGEFRDKAAQLIQGAKFLLKEVLSAAEKKGIEVKDYRDSVVAEGYRALGDLLDIVGKPELSVLREFEMMEAPLAAFSDLQSMFDKLVRGEALTDEDRARMQEISDRKTVESSVRIIYDLADTIEESTALSSDFSLLQHKAHFYINPVVGALHDYLDDVKAEQQQDTWTQSLASGEKHGSDRKPTR